MTMMMIMILLLKRRRMVDEAYTTELTTEEVFNCTDHTCYGCGHGGEECW